MKLKVLVDNNTFIDEYYLGEPAVSYYIEDTDTKILFDTGYSKVFIKNAKNMKVELSDIQKVVLSHGHNDHTGGLKYLLSKEYNNEVELIAHPECFNMKFFDNEYIGVPVEFEKLKQQFKMNLSKKPVQISENIIFLGEIPQINDFEKREVIGNYQDNHEIMDDYVNDDSAIAYKSDKGLFIITGCSHSGICNIIEYAKKICNENRVYGVIGGFHLFEVNNRLLKTIDYFEKNNIKKIYPCHCVSLKAKIEMSKKIEINEVGVGLQLMI